MFTGVRYQILTYTLGCASQFHTTYLDDATLGKPGHLAVRGCHIDSALSRSTHWQKVDRDARMVASRVWRQTVTSKAVMLPIKPVILPSTKTSAATRKPDLIFRYWKPKGVLSTTLPTDDGVNILESSAELNASILETTGGKYVVPIGRLDKDSHGLLLLTTNKRITGKLLRPTKAQGSEIEKEYHVQTTVKVKDEHLVTLRSGMEISVRKKGKRDRIKLLPCVVERLEPSDPCSKALRFILQEGKQRQIRKMV